MLHPRPCTILRLPSPPRPQALRPCLLLFLLFLLLSLSGSSLAHSSSADHGRLTQYELLTPSDVRIQLLPRKQRSPSSPPPSLSSPTLQHDDAFRLSFSAYNQTFYLHMRPNHAILHPNAKVTMHGQTHENTSVKALNPQDFRIYRGVVYDKVHSDARWSALTGNPSHPPSPLQDLLLSSPSPSGLLNASLISPSYPIHGSPGIVQQRGKEEEEEESFPGVLGWSRITVHHHRSLDTSSPGSLAFEGTFTLGSELYHIKHADSWDIVRRPDDPLLPTPSSRPLSLRHAQLMIYRDADKMHKDSRSGHWSPGESHSCGQSSSHHAAYSHFSSLTQPVDTLLGSTGHRRLQKRANAGCPTSKMILYMGVAADCAYVTSYKNQDAARAQILQVWNQASAVYERTFNVVLGIILLDIRAPACPSTPDPAWNRACSSDYPIGQRLSDFSKWRGDKGDDGAGLWHLMTQCNTGSKVGIAWMKSLCDTKAISAPGDPTQGQAGTTEYQSGTGVSSIVKDEWKVVAHEIGHNFGAQHDCESSTCPCSNAASCGCCPCDDQCDCQATYLMNPTAGVKTSDFSPCSQRDICSNYQSLSRCLEPYPGSKQTYSIAMCGNGLKEAGEECDCGSSTECANDPCCDGSTCKLKAGATCADKNDACCKDCKVRSAGYVCRAAISVCDIPESCSGSSPDCPKDERVKDGEDCSIPGASGTTCASGLCTSRDIQCQTRSSSQLNLTTACPSTNLADKCSLTCQNPRAANACYELSGTFLDGTPCGRTGFCTRGECSGDSIWKAAAKYFREHVWLPILISVLGASLLLCCIWRCFRGRKAAHAMMARATPVTGPSARHPPPHGGSFSTTPLVATSSAFASTATPPTHSGPAYPAPTAATYGNPNPAPPYPGPTPEDSSRMAGDSHFVDTTPYNGPSYPMQPQGPPPHRPF